MLHIFLRVVEAQFRKKSPAASVRGRLGAVSFMHRFGAALNRHLHFHCCIIQGCCSHSQPVLSSSRTLRH
jgi:hypothetical protein